MSDVGHAVDNDFGHAVRSASRAIFSRRPPAWASVSELVAYLRSDRPIGRGEREYLADLVAGELQPPRGRSTLKAPERTRRRDALNRLKQVKAAGRSHAKALTIVSEELHIDDNQLDEWFRTRKHD